VLDEEVTLLGLRRGFRPASGGDGTTTMSLRVLVTGGSGVLGRELVSRLRERAEVRVLSRRSPREPGFVQGDLETGAGLAAALDGVDAVAHCASAADYRRPTRDVTQTRRLLDAVAGARPHLVYSSIVGVDRLGWGFFRAKLASERLIEDSGLPWTTLRATEFHDLMLAKPPVAVVARGARFQPVDARDVAQRMAELVLGPATGRARDLGGPRVERMDDLMRAYLTAARRSRPLASLPLPGKLGAAFGVGDHLLTDGDRGTHTFEDYLRSRAGADGAIQHPY
jgi:uncharacterized protein YbjT (DUF2867 family)